MKKVTLLLLAIIILGSCSAPKYAYNFDYHDYHAGKKQTADQQKPILPADPSFMVASNSNEPMIWVEPTSANTLANQDESVVLTKTQRKALKTELKKMVKENKTSRKAGKEQGVTKATASGIDHDLKLAAIFGAVGVVGLIIGGNVFYVIGAIALLIGVVFFVKWLVRQ